MILVHSVLHCNVQLCITIEIRFKDHKMWSVLRDDFVMGAKLKDWDKKNEEDDSSAPEDMDSDVD